MAVVGWLAGWLAATTILLLNLALNLAVLYRDQWYPCVKLSLFLENQISPFHYLVVIHTAY